MTIGALVEHTVRATGTDVPIQFAPGIASRHILVDKRRFERIFANLFENAQRYAGGATLLAVEDHGSLVRFLVEDAGPGIAPEERDRIFERFSRGSTGPAPRARRRHRASDWPSWPSTCSQHGGRVWVEDRPGGGARFVVELPALEEDGGMKLRRRLAPRLPGRSPWRPSAGCGLPVDSLAPAHPRLARYRSP